MTTQEIADINKKIADRGGWELITNWHPHVWRNGRQKIAGIGFHKADHYSELMQFVEKLETEDSLHITIKGHECYIDKLYLTRHDRLITIDGTTKQAAIWLAVAEYFATSNSQEKGDIK